MELEAYDTVNAYQLQLGDLVDLNGSVEEITLFEDDELGNIRIETESGDEFSLLWDEEVSLYMYT